MQGGSENHSNEPQLSSSLQAKPTGSPSPSGSRSNRRSWDHLSFPSSSTDSLEQDVGGAMRPYPRGHGIAGYSTPQTQTKSRMRGDLKRPMSSSFSGVRYEEERFSAGVSHHVGVAGGVVKREQTKGFIPRSEPDGQSDISSTSPDIVVQRSQRTSVASFSSALSPPPCTPNTGPTDQREALATPIIPAMLQSALDALEGIADKDTPLSLTPRQLSTEYGQGAILPEAVTNALTEWISSQSLGSTSGGPSHSSMKGTPLLTPPPSTPSHTPMESLYEPGQVSERQGISAGELITALSTLKVSGEEKRPGSGGSEGSGLSVPACTPSEGAGIEGWAKLGIRPEEVIQALSALTIQQVYYSNHNSVFSTV